MSLTLAEYIEQNRIHKAEIDGLNAKCRELNQQLEYSEQRLKAAHDAIGTMNTLLNESSNAAKRAYQYTQPERCR